MTVAQKFLMITAALAAGTLVLANPNSVFKLAQSVSQVTGGTETQIISAKAKSAGL